MDSKGYLDLTDVGMEVANKIYDRHCFFSDLLTDVGVSKEIAERDACQIEHAISEESFQMLKSKYNARREDVDGD